MLVKDIGRDREDTARLPFESPLTAVFVPHGSRPLAVDDHHRLVEQLAAGHGFFAAWDFQNHGVVDDRVGQIDERAVGVARLPVPDRNFSQVFDKKPGVDRDALLALPAQIRIKLPFLRSSHLIFSI